MKSGLRAIPAAVSNELVALYQAADWAKLVVVARKVSSKYPLHLLGWRAASKALLQMGKAGEAIEALQKVVKIAPKEADGFNDLGTAYHAVGRFQDAIDSYRIAVMLNPAESAGYTNLGRVLCDLRQFEAAAQCCQQAVAIDPRSPLAHNNLGNALRELGRLVDAQTCYLNTLALKPDYLEAMINLASNQETQGLWAEAKATYRQAAQLHPQSALAHAALGRLLARLGEEDDEAEQHLRQALAFGMVDADAYAELGNILMRKHEAAAALVMFQISQKIQPLMKWPANRPTPSFSAVFLDTPMGGSTPVRYVAGRADYDRLFYAILPDTALDADLVSSKADVIFNMISNVDDGQETLALAIDLLDRIDRPVINHPRTILNTGREVMALRLADIAGCAVPKTIRVTGDEMRAAIAAQHVEGLELPLLARVAGTHGGHDFAKFDDWATLGDFAATYSDKDFYFIEYINYQNDDGLYRKYRVIFTDDAIWPYHLAIHDHWLVHHFRTDMANHEWMRQEEERFLANMDGVFNPAQQDTLRAIARATGLDYGGIDCSIDESGRIVVFETNASMLVHDETTELYAYKNPYVAKIKTAFDAMLARRVG